MFTSGTTSRPKAVVHTHANAVWASRLGPRNIDLGPDDRYLVYLPFLIIDLVVANVLLALGMQMLNPTQVSLPFKLLLFVAIDGWGLLARALVAGYQ